MEWHTFTATKLRLAKHLITPKGKSFQTTYPKNRETSYPYTKVQTTMCYETDSKGSVFFVTQITTILPQRTQEFFLKSTHF